MTTKKPRLTITLEPALAAQLRTISELTGNSQSGLISELLEGSGPVFDRMIEVLQAAQKAKDSMRGKLANDLEQAQSKMEKGLGLVMDGLGQFLGEEADHGGAVDSKRSVAAAAPGGDSTPISNRGVRLDPTATKKIAQNRLRVRPKTEKLGTKTRGVK